MNKSEGLQRIYVQREKSLNETLKVLDLLGKGRAWLGDWLRKGRALNEVRRIERG